MSASAKGKATGVAKRNTVDYVTSDLAGAKALVESTATDYRAWVEAGGSKTTAAMVATREALHQGYLGGDSPVETQEAFGARFGVKKPEVTFWVRGARLIDLGITEAHPLWAPLVKGKALKATNVAKVVMSPGASITKVREAIKADGRNLTTGEKSSPPAKGGSGPRTSSKDEGTESEDISTPDAAFESAKAHLLALSAACKALPVGADGWPVIERGLLGLLKREQTLRAPKVPSPATVRPSKAGVAA